VLQAGLEGEVVEELPFQRLQVAMVEFNHATAVVADEVVVGGVVADPGVGEFARAEVGLGDEAPIAEQR